MSNNLFSQGFQFKNIPIKKKSYQCNDDVKSKNKKINKNEKNKSPISGSIKKNKNSVANNEIINYKNLNNKNLHSINNNFVPEKKLVDKKDIKFISISQFPESIESNMYDNLNYIKIVKSTIIENAESNSKIKTVDANKYLNNGGNLVSTFKDFKLKLLDKNNKFNTPFVFYKNNIDLSNSEKVENEKNYQIKRYRYLTTYRYSFNPIVRRNNSKIIQQWWRNRINPKIDKRKKIIKIQSIFRGFITRKTLNEIICISVIYQNFINKLRHALGNYVHRIYFPKRYYKKKYVFEKIFPLKLKVFFRRWKNLSDQFSTQDKAARFLFKSRQKNRYILLELKQFFDIWKLKCKQIQKNEEKDLSIKNQQIKFCSLAKIFHILEKTGKKIAYNLIRDNIHNYLKSFFLKKYLKKLLEFYNKFKTKKIMKIYFDLWRKQIWREKQKNLKLKIIANEIKTLIRKNDKDFKRNNLNNLRAKANFQTINDLKRAKKLFLFPEGGKHITLCIRKNIIRLVIKEYLRKINIEKKLLKIIKKKLLKYHIRKWNKKIEEILHKVKCLNHLRKIIYKIGHIFYNNILAKYFNRWKNKVFMNIFKEQKINIYKRFCDSLKKYITKSNKNIKQHKHIFLKTKLNNFINHDSEILKKQLIKCFNNYLNKDRILCLKITLNKWKKYITFCKLNDLKAKNLETVSRLTKIIYDSKKLSKNLHDWKEKNNEINLLNKYKFREKIKILIDCLDKIKKNRIKYLFDNLRIAKNTFMKKIILKNLSNKYTEKLLAHYFNKYKFNIIKLHNKYQFENMDKLNKLKYIVNSKIKKEHKNIYGILKKYLYKWYLISKIIKKEKYEQFLLNIKNAIKIINSTITEKALRNVFEKIKNASVNLKNIILKRLKKYFSKNEKINLRKAFHKFLKNVQLTNNNILKSIIIYNLKLKKEQLMNRTLITKYFNKWKAINNVYKNKRNINTLLIANKITKIINRKNQKYFFEYLNNIKYKYDISELSKKIFKLYSKVEKRNLSKNLNRWKNISKKIHLIMIQKKRGSEIIYKTLTKIYSYKKIEDILVPALKNSFKKRYYKEFIDKFKKYFISKINSNYKVSLKSRKTSINYNFKFKKSIKPNYPTNKKALIDENIAENKNIEKRRVNPRLSRYKIPRFLLNQRKSNFNKVEEKELKNILISNLSGVKKDKFYMERLIPYLVNYLNNLRLNKLRLVFKYFNYINKNKLFCLLLKSWTKEQNNIFKKKLIKSLKQSIIKEKLLLYMRKSIIHKLAKRHLIIINRRNSLFILMHKMKVFKRINQKKKIKRFIRVWRVFVRFRKDRTARLEKFEKSFNQTYEKISDSIFFDKGDEKSVQTQIMGFFDKININEKNKLKNSIGMSLSSFNSNLPGKTIKYNEQMNGNNINYTFQNDIDNESNIDFSNISNKYVNEEKSLTYSNNSKIRNIKSSVFSSINSNK